MTATFIHLRLHTEYSLVNGLIRIKPLVQQTVAARMPAVAVTDMSNLFAAVKFYKAAHTAGIKPLIGVDLWVQRGRSNPARLTLLCQNATGYRHLTRLVSRCYLEGQQHGVPVLAYDWLASATEGLIALSGGREGELGLALLHGKITQARRRLDEWRRLFPDRFYLEAQRTGRPDEENYIDAAVELAAATGAPVVATNDVRFLRREDFAAHEARVCIQEGYTLADPRRLRPYSEQQYLRTPEEMADLFADLPEALENSVEIARRCNLHIELGKASLPDFPLPVGVTAEGYFSEQARMGLNKRLRRLFPADTPDWAARRQPYDQRLEQELAVINQMGFAGYFLIVADFIQWARAHGVPVGPGRGSGAGSLAAYALGITDLDPLAYDLLFERFLNPERVSMPDFDVDFCMEGRDRVIDYVAARYGRDKVAQIATHGSMAAKAVIRDVGRVLGYPYPVVDRIAKLVPFELGITLDKALAQDEEFRKAYAQEEDVRNLVDLAHSLEGLARNVGRHAGGVVIAPSVLTDFSPLYREDGSQAAVTQYDKDDVESVGLVKFDFLGLRTLTIIDWALQTINRQRTARGEELLDIAAIPLNDAATFGLLKAYRTTAVFQLESRGMKDLIKRLQPDRFEDIIALVALFRPGPLQSGMVDDFIDRKHGRARVEYPHPDLERILEPTYGVILYQEQVMQIAQVLASYTLGSADLLRRAMGKKDAAKMAQQRAVFAAGAAERGVDPGLANYIFDLMEKFAGYGFNKSHSAAYALISYQTAWLKAHHPAAFMAAVLSSDMDKTDKVVVFMEEARSMSLTILPPQLNLSDYRFTVDDQGRIVYGLGAVKGMGEAAVEHMLDERRRNGAFHDLFDLCRRADLRKVNRRVLEALLRCGALDGLAANRATLMAQLPEALRLAEQDSRAGDAGQVDLFGLPTEVKPLTAASTVADAPEWDRQQLLEGEKETLGLYLTGHPIERFQTELEHIVTHRLADLPSEEHNGAASARRFGRNDAKRVVIAGLVASIRTRTANRGGRMAFVTLDDRSARVEIRVFPEAYEQYHKLLVDDAILVVQGSLVWDEFADSLRVNVERVLDMDAARDEYACRLVLAVEAGRCGNGLLEHLATALSPWRQGKCPVWVDYTGAGVSAAIVLGENWRVKPSEALLQELRGLVGEEKVRVVYS